MRFDENPLGDSAKTEDKKAEGFQILHFYWSFSSDIMAVKGSNPFTAMMPLQNDRVQYLKSLGLVLFHINM